MLGVAQLMVILDNTIVNIALPTAQHDLHFSNADRQWVVTGYSLAFGSLLLLGGRIGDIIGRKRALLIGLVGFAFASALGGASTGFPMLVIARSIQGAFGALLAPSVLALLATTFTDPAERGKAFAIYGGIAGAGGAIGLLLGGILTSYASWRWTLFVNLAFAAVAATGALLWLKNDRAADHDPLDIPGLLLVTGGSLLHRLRPLPRRDDGLDQPVHHRLPGGRRGPPRRLRPARDPGPLPAAAAPGGAQPDPRRLAAGHAVRQHRDLRRLPLPDLLPAGHPRLQPGEDRLRLPARWSPPWPARPRCPTGSCCPRSGPKIIVPDRPRCCDAVAMFVLHRVGLHSSYASHVLPYLILLGFGFGLSLAPVVQHRHPGAAAPRRRRRLGHPQHQPAGRRLDRHGAAQHPGRRGRDRLPGGQGRRPRRTCGSAALHSYTTAFLWSSAFFVVGAVVAGLVLASGATSSSWPVRPAPPGAPVPVHA